jgi:hypothetical protein
VSGTEFQMPDIDEISINEVIKGKIQAFHPIQFDEYNHCNFAIKLGCYLYACTHIKLILLQCNV